MTKNISSVESGEPVLASLQAALSSFNEELILVDASNWEIIWHTSPTVRHIPNTKIGRQLSEVCEALVAPSEQLLADSTSSSENMSMLTLSVNETAKSVVCRLHSLDGNLVLIKLGEPQSSYAHMHKYMADREKLFTTSRTISVSEMATTLAHELNQPIGSITNLMNGIRSRLKKAGDISDDIYSAIDKVLDQSYFASRIISRIRDFTHARKPIRVDANIHNILVETIELLDWVIAQSSVKVVIKPSVETVNINGDITMLQQVFSNLLRNAIEAMGETSQGQRILTIDVTKQDNEVQVHIVDRGHGLSDAAEANLFVPFVTHKAQGMGVGLNICRSFVELHQGRLWLAPNEFGGCTSFVALPDVDALSVQGSGQ